MNSTLQFASFVVPRSSRYLRAVRCLRLLLPYLLVSLAVSIACDALQAQQAGALGRLVVVGDSLSAGYQNGSLLDVQQPNGYANLVAQQAEAPLSLPLIAAPGIPNVLQLVSPGPPPIIQRAPGSSTGRDDLFTQATDLAVPGANVQDALTTRPGLPVANLTDLILGFPGLFSGISRSQVEWTEALAPNTVIVWLGNNDALGAAVAGDASLLTPLASFQAAYDQVMRRVAAMGARMVVATIPDVTAVPYFTSAQQLADELGLPLAVIGPPLGIAAGDYVTPDAFALIQPILAGQVQGPLPPNVVLDAGEVAQVRAAVDAYNAFIAAEAVAYGTGLADVHALTARIQARGYMVLGRRLTTHFLGGVFSLDGIHPTNTGYAIIANEFIHAANTALGTDIPRVSIDAVAAADPLILPPLSVPASAFGHINSEEAANTRHVFAHEK